MSQAKNGPLTGGLSVYDEDRQEQNAAPASVFEDTRYSVSKKVQQNAADADLRSPADCYHPEAYLIGCLVRLYGWRVIEPGVLRRSWRNERAAAPLQEAA
jgi:hypothetical protein